MGAVKTICLISFLDAFVFDLIFPFRTVLILKLGGCHTDIGIIASLRAIFSKFSHYLMVALLNKWEINKVLKLTLLLNCASFFSLGICKSIPFLIVTRSIYYLFNSSSDLCDIYLHESENEESRKQAKNLIQICRKLGHILGPLVTGFILSLQFEEFPADAIIGIATAATCFSFVLCLSLPTLPSRNHENDLSSDIIFGINNLCNIEWHKQWTVLALKFCTAGAHSAYFGKIQLILLMQFGASPFMIGCMQAYIKMVTFLSKYLIMQRDFYPNTYTINMPMHFASYFVFMVIVCWISSFEYYMLALSLIIFCEVIIQHKWTVIYENVRSRKNDVVRAGKDVEFISDIVTPTIIGIYCDKYTYNAATFFSTMFLLIALFISYYVPKQKTD